MTTVEPIQGAKLETTNELITQRWDDITSIIFVLYIRDKTLSAPFKGSRSMPVDIAARIYFVMVRQASSIASPTSISES